MAPSSAIPVPWRLLLRRAQYQVVPILTMLICTALVGWMWMRNARSHTVFGEVNAVRVSVESKFDGMLVELPQPVEIFDTVRKGQVVARIDVEAAELQLQRLLAEVESLRASQGAESGEATPAGAAIREREARIAELRARIEARDITSPIDGTVMQIFERPGESVKLALPGDSARLAMPIMTIAANRGDFIIGYVRPTQMLRPEAGMRVTIRPQNSASGGSIGSHVMSVAPQLQALPNRYLRDPDIVEFALPVQIALPAESDLKPGEMVDIVFYPNQHTDAR